MIARYGSRHKALPQAPAGIVSPEFVYHTFFSEQVVERQMQFRQAVHIGCDVVKVVGESIRVDEGLRTLRICENGLHLGLSAEHSLLEYLQFPVQAVIRGGRLYNDGCIRPEVINVVFAGVHRDGKRIYWASRNLGATADIPAGTSEAEIQATFGDFFAWGGKLNLIIPRVTHLTTLVTIGKLAKKRATTGYPTSGTMEMISNTKDIIRRINYPHFFPRMMQLM